MSTNVCRIIYNRFLITPLFFKIIITEKIVFYSIEYNTINNNNVKLLKTLTNLLFFLLPLLLSEVCHLLKHRLISIGMRT